jgi:hypothetical protein
MKRKALLAAAAALMVMSSCNKESTIPSVSTGQKVSIDVSIVSKLTPTKVSGEANTSSQAYHTADEAAINNLQVFVFAGDALDGYAAVESGSTEVECTAGTRDIYCIVNAPSLSEIRTKAALLATTSSLAEDSDNFEMVGYKAGQQITREGSSQFTVEVSRIASKIVVKAIQNALKVQGPMTVRRVYITNVAGEINYGLDNIPDAQGVWFNKGGYQVSNNLGSFTQDLDQSAEVASGDSYSVGHYFYAYPNDNAYVPYNNSGWVPKRTLLVVQIEYNGALYDYPVDLGVDLEPNKMYVINNLKLVNLGNPDDGGEGGEDEENIVSGASVEVDVQVVDWGLILLGDERGEIII